MDTWVKYTTINHPGGGAIDVWRGDCINNPNNPTKSNVQLNALALFYRLNGAGDWINSRDFDGGLMSWMQINPTEKMEDIWNAALRITK